MKRLLPVNSMISGSILSKKYYHVLKFYQSVENDNQYEALDKHELGKCKYCKNIKREGSS